MSSSNRSRKLLRTVLLWRVENLVFFGLGSSSESKKSEILDDCRVLCFEPLCRTPLRNRLAFDVAAEETITSSLDELIRPSTLSLFPPPKNSVNRRRLLVARRDRLALFDWVSRES